MGFPGRERKQLILLFKIVMKFDGSPSEDGKFLTPGKDLLKSDLMQQTYQLEIIMIYRKCIKYDFPK